VKADSQQAPFPQMETAPNMASETGKEEEKEEEKEEAK